MNIDTVTLELETKVTETAEDFIFTTVRRWIGSNQEIGKTAISKRILKRALYFYMTEHAEEYHMLSLECADRLKEAEKENAKATKAQIDELISWAECFEAADIGTKHLIVARLIDRIEVKTGYKVYIKFKISLKQFLGQE